MRASESDAPTCGEGAGSRWRAKRSQNSFRCKPEASRPMLLEPLRSPARASSLATGDGVKPLKILAQPQRVIDGGVGITLGHAVANAEQQVSLTALFQTGLGLDREQGFHIDLALVA